MKKVSKFFITTTLAALFLPTLSFASVITSAVSVQSTHGGLSSYFALDNIINQSSLSSSYISGVTDFAVGSSATSGLLSGSGFDAVESYGPIQFSFDLGTSLTIDALAIWNTNSVGAISQIEIWSDNDMDWSNGATSMLVGSSALTTSSSSDIFSFSAIDSQFFHINALSSLAPPDYYGLNEVAFSEVVNVPEPSILFLMGAGLAGLGFARRRKLQQAE